MVNNRNLLIGSIFLALFIILTNNVYADVFNNPSTTSFSAPSLETYYSNIGFDINTVWPNFDNSSKCQANQDFVVNIRPGSCMPAVVRSDLLEDQNVPVFCEMDALKINPLISTQKIKRVYIKTNNQSTAIAGASYYPSKSAIGANGITVDNPLITDVGYVVVSLKQMPEKDMPDYVTANLTAVIEYDVENAFGIGKSVFYLPLIDESNWGSEYTNYGFWKGAGFLRLEYVNDNETRISIYKDKDNLYKSFVVKKGQTSEVIFMPGFYCQAGLKINFVGQELPKTRALLDIDGVSGWITEGETLSNGCVINTINKDTSQVEITCRGKKATLSVGFSDYVKINNENTRIGGVLNAGNQDYLLYYGKTISLDDVTKNQNPKDFIIIGKKVRDINILNGNIKQATIDTIKKDVNAKLKTNLPEKDFVDAVTKAVASDLGTDASNIFIIKKGDAYSTGGYTFNDLVFVEKKGADYGADGTNIEKYFTEAKNTEQEIVDSYKNEKIDLGSGLFGDYYGAVALADLAKTAGTIGKQLTQKELLDKLIQDYPDSASIPQAQRDLESLNGYDYSSATSFFDIDGKTSVITLKDVEYPNINEASAKFDIYNAKGDTMEKQDIVKGLGEEIFSENGKVILTLKSIPQKDKVIVSYKYKDDKGAWVDHPGDVTLSISNDKPTTISEGDISIKLVNINAEYLAKINVVPEIKNGQTQSDFIVNVGIEKRAIQLSPEETKNRIQNLNKTIDQLEKATESLGNVVKAWKAACLATTVALSVKNMIANTGGQATARQHVMQDSGGWTDKCKQMMKDYPEKYPTIDKCFAMNADAINKDVETVTTALNNINTQIEAAQKGLTNEKAIAQNFATSSFNNFVSQNKDTTFTAKDNTPVKISQVFGTDNANIQSMIDSGQLTLQDMRDIMFASELSKVSDINTTGTNKINSLMKPIYQIQIDENNKAKDKVAVAGLLGADAQSYTIETKDSINVPVAITKATADKNGLIKDTNYVSVVYQGTTYIVPLTQPNTKVDEYFYDNSKKILDKDGNEVTKPTTQNADSKTPTDTIFSMMTKVKFTQITPKMCQNVYNVLNKKIAVYDTEPNKGVPQLVPFDLKQGWYIAIKPSTVSLTSSTSSSTSAGMLSSFWLCNVGTNKNEDFEKGIDDICTKIDMNSNQPLDELPCLTKAEAIAKIKLGVTTVSKVESEYAKGSKGITIDGTYFTFERAVNVPNLNCQDFMSPGDCTFLYNACDPVLCPASRCNLGGKWPTTDVVQEGIIGSLVLCLPNAGPPSEGGVVVPICLTGVQAGLDAWTSVLKAHRDCLQENLNSGKYIGICDEMYSVYMCEFFWRQAAPLLRIGIPKLIEGIVYGKSQGGGEYLTVQDSWKNMENSFNYFTNVYGVNAFEAFKKRSTGNIGTEVCKSFVSANYPSSADTIDQLLEPESPVQFFARFDEIPFSDATVTPTSQYKVYYHIYAGKDSGVNYQVYLKATSASTQFFNLQDSILIKTGYITAGATVDETKDFTAPTGYKELCVSLNGQEKCGFGQVTTDYGLNYLTDQYAAQQGNQTSINSESQCISGTSSAYSLVNPNIQEGISNAISSDISSSLGITRICSTGEPGGTTTQTTDKTIIQGATYSSTSGTAANWVMVGYCDKANNIICWADKNSIKNAIKNTELENATLSNLQTAQDAIFKSLKIVKFDESTTLTALKTAKDKLTEGEEPSPNYLNLINEFIQKSTNNNLKANVLYNYKFVIYDKLVNFVYGKVGKNCEIDLGGTCQAHACEEGKKTLAGICSMDGICCKTITTESTVAAVANPKGVNIQEDASGNFKIYLEDIYTKIYIDKDNVRIMQDNFNILGFNTDTQIGRVDPLVGGGYKVNLDNDGKNLLALLNIQTTDLEKAIDDYFSETTDTEGTGALTPDSSFKMPAQVETTASFLTGQKTAGTEILKLAQAYQETKGITDKSIQEATGNNVKSFGCLVLMQTMQESSLWHCKITDPGFKVAKYDYSYCNGKPALLNINSGTTANPEKSVGIRQINLLAHNDITLQQASDFDTNANYGINYLYEQYKACNNWLGALSNYNGNGGDCKTKSDYINKVLSRATEIQNNFPQCGLTGTGTSGTASSDAPATQPESSTPASTTSTISTKFDFTGDAPYANDIALIKDFLRLNLPEDVYYATNGPAKTITLEGEEGQQSLVNYLTTSGKFTQTDGCDQTPKKGDIIWYQFHWHAYGWGVVGSSSGNDIYILRVIDGADNIPEIYAGGIKSLYVCNIGKIYRLK